MDRNAHPTATPVVGALPLALLLTAALGLVLDIAGALHVYNLSHLLGLKLSVAVAAVLCGIAMGWLLLAAAGREPLLASARPWLRPLARASPAPRWLQRLLTGLVLLAWLASARSYSVFLAGSATPTVWLVFGSGTLLLLVALVRVPPPGIIVLGAMLYGGVVRVFGFAHLELIPPNGDMLPLVQHALGSLLAGRSPYALYEMPWQLPLTYLPATWLAYLPPYALGLDVRLTNLTAELLTGGALLWYAARRLPASETGPARLLNPALTPAVLLWAWMFVQPSVINWSLSNTAPVLWCWLTLLLVLLLSGHNWPAAVLLGLCAAASPLVSVAAVFVLLFWLRQAGWRQTLRYSLLAGVVTAALVLPFLLWAPEQFIYGTLRWFNDNSLYPQLRWDMDSTWARQMGFSGVFWRYEVVYLLKPIQAGLVVGLLALFWRWGGARWQLAPFISAAYLLFVVFNPVLWPYLYNPALVVALLACITLAGESRDEERA